MKILRIAVLGLGLGLSCTSCTSLPDTSGYTAGTIELRNSARLAGQVAADELRRGFIDVPGSTVPADLSSRREEFETEWARTVRSLDALVAYAESIEELTRAGNDGAQAAVRIGDSVGALAGAVGLVPGANLIAVATETAGFINSAIANVRAAGALDRSVRAAEPVIRDAASVLREQIGAAADVHRRLVLQQRIDLDTNYGFEINVRDRLRDVARSVAGSAADGASSAALAEEAGRLRAGREAIAPRLAEYDRLSAEADARDRSGRELFAATQAALDAWRAAHAQLVTSLEERRPVSFQSLLAAGEDVRTLVQRWRTL